MLDGFVYAVRFIRATPTVPGTTASCVRWARGLQAGGLVALASPSAYAVTGQQIVAALTPCRSCVGRPPFTVAGHPAAGRSVVLFAGRHVYRRHARCRDAQQAWQWPRQDTVWRCSACRLLATTGSGWAVFLALRGLACCWIWHRHQVRQLVCRTLNRRFVGLIINLSYIFIHVCLHVFSRVLPGLVRCLLALLFLFYF